jgi:hypothetical protein
VFGLSDCSVRQRRTAGLIPDWLNSSASPTLHVAAAICIREATILSVSVSCAPHLTHAAAAQQLDKAITPDGVPSTGSPHAARRFTDRHSRRRREQCGHGRAASVKCHVGCTDLTSGMRDLDTVDSEPRLLAAVRRSIREHGGEPSSRQVDELLDERLLLARR